MFTEPESVVSLTSEEEENAKYKVSLCSVFLTILGLLFYILDIVTDILLALWYLKHGHYRFCVLTLYPIYLATVIDLLASWFRNELNNKDRRFWFKCIALSLVHFLGFKIIYSLIKTEYNAYKTERVDDEMRDRIRKKTIRVAWLKYNEGAFEASLQTMIQPSILSYIGEISPYQLPFVTECGELEAIINSIDIPLPVLLSFVMSLSSAVIAVANLDTASRLRKQHYVSTVGIFIQDIWLILTAVSRILSILLILLMYPIYTISAMLLHILVGSVFWYNNFSNKRQSVVLRCIKALLNGTRWLLSPYYRFKWRRMLFTLQVVHLIGNAAATAAWAYNVTSPYSISILNCLIYTVGTSCCGLYYWCYGGSLTPRNSSAINANSRPSERISLTPIPEVTSETFDY